MGEQVLRWRQEVLPEWLDVDAPTLTMVREWPRLYVHDRVLDEATCRALAALGDDARLGRYLTHDPTGTWGEVPIDHSPEVERAGAILDATLGFSSVSGSTLRFRVYEPGEWHPAHADRYQIDGAWLVATAMLCVEAGAGGETVFPLACGPVAVPPRVGRVVAWFNHVRSGEPDPLAMHHAEPVRSGRKVTLTLFAYADPSSCGPLRTGLPTGACSP